MGIAWFAAGFVAGVVGLLAVLRWKLVTAPESAWEDDYWRWRNADGPGTDPGPSRHEDSPAAARTAETAGEV